MFLLGFTLVEYCFFALLLISIGIGSFSSRDRAWGGGILSILFLAGLSWWAMSLFTLSFTLVEVVTYAVGYLVMGLVWPLIYWIWNLYKLSEFAKDRARTYSRDTAIYRREVKEEGNRRGLWPDKSYDDSQVTPTFAGSKETIFYWSMFWPFVMLDVVLNDLLSEIFQIPLTLMKGIFNKIAEQFKLG